MELFDSHAHYNDEKFEVDRDKIIQETFQKDVSNFIVAGYNLESSKKAVEIANGYEGVYAIIGISPNDIEGITTQNEIQQAMKMLEEILLPEQKKQ